MAPFSSHRTAKLISSLDRPPMTARLLSSEVIFPNPANAANPAEKSITLTKWDDLAKSMTVRIFFFYRKSLDLDKLRQALIVALEKEFPILAGRLICEDNGQWKVLLWEEEQSSAGAEWRVAETSIPFDTIVPQFTSDGGIERSSQGREKPKLMWLIGNPSCQISDYDGSQGNNRHRLFRAQVTRFPGGETCVAVNIPHILVDGDAAFYFMKRWAQISQSLDVIPPINTLPNRIDAMSKITSNAEKVPRDFKSTSIKKLTWWQSLLMKWMFSILLLTQEESATHQIFITKDQLAKLKREATQNFETSKDTTADVQPLRISTLDALSAHLWRCFQSVYRSSSPVSFSHAVNLRPRLAECFPDGAYYFGNFSEPIYTEPIANVAEQPLNVLAHSIRKSIHNYVSPSNPSAHIRMVNFITWLVTQPANQKMIFGGTFNDTRMSSWRDFPAYEVQFAASKDENGEQNIAEVEFVMQQTSPALGMVLVVLPCKDGSVYLDVYGKKSAIKDVINAMIDI
ncbi:uncharacterized protein VTP21DRAFT_6904 [Calcarisporiella thermophila]|uniref:uncharacterized protein n=1 Tax=Calcarisporiella thermophila TaxID=911321 RepID=UPI00374446FC